MHEIEQWIDAASQGQSIPIRRLPRAEAASVQLEIASKYVTTKTPCTWWWNFKQPPIERHDRNLIQLSRVLPDKSGPCWLIPDTDTEWLPVYELDAGQVEKLIADCPGFEYYVAAHDFSWLLVETHHDQFHICR